ncbi:MAG: prepilin peptidase [Pseudomonadota bacterium]
MAGTILLFVFPLLLLIAAIYDLTTMTIPNWVCGVVIVAFPMIALAAGMDLSLMANHISAGAVMLVLGIVLFSVGLVGGGDAKLIAGIAVWCGWSALFPFLLFAAIFGGVLTGFLMAFRAITLPRWMSEKSWIVRLHSVDNGVPYGIALALGGILIYQDLRVFTILSNGFLG